MGPCKFNKSKTKHLCYVRIYG